MTCLAGFVGGVIEPLADLGREAGHRVGDAPLFLALAGTSTWRSRTIAGFAGRHVELRFPAGRLASPVSCLVDLES